MVQDQQIRAIELKNKKNTVNPVAISSLESNQPIQKVWQWLALKRNTEDQLYAIKLYISHRCKGNKQIKIWTILLWNTANWWWNILAGILDAIIEKRWICIVWMFHRTFFLLMYCCLVANHFYPVQKQFLLPKFVNFYAWWTLNPLLPETFFSSHFEMKPKIGCYRLPTHRSDAPRKFFRWSLLILKTKF